MKSEENNLEMSVSKNKVAHAGQLLSLLIQVVVYCLLLAKLGDILHVATQTKLRYLFVWESSWWIDVVMALYVVCVIVAIVHIVRRNCHIGRGYWLFGGFLTLVWGYIRFFSDKIPTIGTDDVFCFTNLEWLPRLTWADVFVGGLWIMLVTYLVRRLIYRKTRTSEPEREVIMDNPIESEDEDKLDYARWAKIMCQEICDMKNDKAYSYGVVGEWGIGKTSYINLLKRELEETKKTIEIIDFNPRNSSRASRIQEDFLMTLCSSLKKYDLGLSLLTSRYVKALRLDSRIDIIASLLNIFPSGNVQRLRERICESIRRIGRKVVVFIDDLDRMGREEIIEVFKLIDCNASFPNTIFVTAYNKAQVNGILSSYQGEAINDGGVSYSDKYFHRELKLIVNPPYVMSMFLGLISRDLKLKQIFHANSSHDLPLPLIATNFSNVRDLKKFVNQLAEIDIERWRQVDEVQFIMFQIVRYKYNEVYLSLMRKEELGEQVTKADVHRYILKDSSTTHKYPENLKNILGILFDSKETYKYNYISVSCSFDNYFVESSTPICFWSRFESFFDTNNAFENVEADIIAEVKNNDDKRLRTIVESKLNIDRESFNKKPFENSEKLNYQRDVQVLFCCYHSSKKDSGLKKIYGKLLYGEIDKGAPHTSKEAVKNYPGTLKDEASKYIEFVNKQFSSDNERKGQQELEHFRGNNQM